MFVNQFFQVLVGIRELPAVLVLLLSQGVTKIQRLVERLVLLLLQSYLVLDEGFEESDVLVKTEDFSFVAVYEVQAV